MPRRFYTRYGPRPRTGGSSPCRCSWVELPPRSSLRGAAVVVDLTVVHGGELAGLVQDGWCRPRVDDAQPAHPDRDVVRRRSPSSSGPRWRIASHIALIRRRTPGLTVAIGELQRFHTWFTKHRRRRTRSSPGFHEVSAGLGHPTTRTTPVPVAARYEITPRRHKKKRVARPNLTAAAFRSLSNTNTKYRSTALTHTSHLGNIAPKRYISPRVRRVDPESIMGPTPNQMFDSIQFVLGCRWRRTISPATCPILSKSCYCPEGDYPRTDWTRPSE